MSTRQIKPKCTLESVEEAIGTLEGYSVRMIDDGTAFITADDDIITGYLIEQIQKRFRIVAVSKDYKGKVVLHVR